MLEGEPSGVRTSDAVKFKKPPKFSMRELLASAEAEKENLEDPIVVEKVIINKVTRAVAAKVRNVSDSMIMAIRVKLQMLDSMGDVLAEEFVTACDLEAGQAMTTDYTHGDHADPNEVVAVKVVAYCYGNTRSIFYVDDYVRLNNPIIIPIEDVTIK